MTEPVHRDQTQTLESPQHELLNASPSLKTAQEFAPQDFTANADLQRGESQDLVAQSLQGAGLKATKAFSNTDFTEKLSPPEAQLSLSKPRIWPWIVGLGMVGLFALRQWSQWLLASWQQSVIDGVLASGLTLLVVGLMLKYGYQEWRHWQAIAERKQWREKANGLQNSLQFGEASSLCQDIMRSLPSAVIASAQTKFASSCKPEHSDAERLQLFERIVLQEIDQLVAARISEASIQTGVAVALSPFALADLILVLWRASRLVREIASLYGDSPGLRQRFVLLKKFVETLFWTGASELAIDLGSDFFGAELSSKLSARAGQGVLAGLLVARLGRFVQQQLRPLPLVLIPESNSQSLFAVIVQKLQRKSPPAN